MTGNGLRVASYGLRVTGRGLRAAGYGLWVCTVEWLIMLNKLIE